jgi:uncharacterized membrane protein
MQAPLLFHIGAGAIAIVAGAGASFTRKGGKAHRWLGSAFSVSMLLMATSGVYLALFTTPITATAAPPEASATIAILTLYLVTTAWLTVKRKPRSAGAPEFAALGAALAIAAVLLLLGTRAALGWADPRTATPYFAFALFATFAAMLDVRMIRRGGVAGPDRIARHLWRMCMALFFATSFFFLGQQKVMPEWLQGSLVLVILALAPAVAMAGWLIRIWATRTIHGAAGGRSGLRAALAFKIRSAPCAR